MRELVISSPAQGDLDSIVDYLCVELCNPQAADRFLHELNAAYETVRENPYICQTCRDRHLSTCGYRAMAVMRYLMVYRYDEEIDVVHIVRFFHELQDYGNWLLVR